MPAWSPENEMSHNMLEPACAINEDGDQCLKFFYMYLNLQSLFTFKSEIADTAKMKTPNVIYFLTDA